MAKRKEWRPPARSRDTFRRGIMKMWHPTCSRQSYNKMLYNLVILKTSVGFAHFVNSDFQTGYSSPTNMENQYSENVIYFGLSKRINDCEMKTTTREKPLQTDFCLIAGWLSASPRGLPV